MIRCPLSLGLAGLCLALAVATSPADDESNDQLAPMVVKLLADKDKDLRALALDQVRTEARGAAATRQFAAQLPKLAPAVQAALLGALADRGDPAALPAVLELLAASRDESVRAAAVVTVGTLGGAAELPLLVRSLSAENGAERAAARSAAQKLRGESVPGAIAATMKKSPPPIQAVLIEILTERRALGAIDEILDAALDDDAKVRAAAVAALGELASAEHVPRMLDAVLKAGRGPERDAAERAIAVVCGRIDDLDERTSAVLSAWSKSNDQSQIALLPTLGRVGGPRIRSVVNTAMASGDAERREAGLRALCNWPDDFVADDLLRLVETANSPAHRAMTFRAFVRVGGARDQRSDLQRLDRMKQAMAAAKTDEERTLVLNRCRTSYAVESLRFVLPYLEQPEFVQLVCETIVELAHHREVREPNKTEFDPALDKVIVLSKDAVVIDRANRYKHGETWERPNPSDATSSQ